MKQKIAIYVSGGVVQGIRSNIGTELEIEVVDADNTHCDGIDPDTRWEQLQLELPFGNY
jgi:hypothetical protein